MKSLRTICVFGLALALATAPLPAGAFNLPFSAAQVTGAAGASTFNQDAGIITTESLSTAAGATYTETVNCNAVTASSLVFVSIANGSNSAGDPSLQLVTPGAAKVTITIVNRHASAAFNGTLKITVLVFN
jgi:hypothetical protein